MFIKEIFADKSPDDFDEETLVTINKFFENSLNVSQRHPDSCIFTETHWYIAWTSFKKSTGLDLRVFEGCHYV